MKRHTASDEYRPAAGRVSQWCRARISHWAVWACVQYYGAKLQEQLARDWWPEKAHDWRTDVVVTEMDATWLKRQRHGTPKTAPAYFLMQLGLHDTGREARYQDGGGRSVVLAQKSWLAGAERVGLFGVRLRRQRDRHYGANPALSVVLSDGDEGLERMREAEFGEAVWLLDRWHVARRVREWAGADQEAYRRIMAGVYASDSEAVLEALRAERPPVGSVAERRWRELFGYVCWPTGRGLMPTGRLPRAGDGTMGEKGRWCEQAAERWRRQWRCRSVVGSRGRGGVGIRCGRIG